MLARSKWNSIEALMSQALRNFEISHEDLIINDLIKAIINEEENYTRLKEDIRMIKSQRNEAEKDKLIEEGSRIGINIIIRQNNENA